MSCVPAGDYWCAQDADCCSPSAACDDTQQPGAGSCVAAGGACGWSTDCTTQLPCDAFEDCTLPYDWASCVQPVVQGVCVAPAEAGHACSPRFGCDGGLVCLDAQTSAFGDLGNVCEVPCQKSADCQDPTETCQGSDAGFCFLATCDGNYSSCNSRGQGDGTCYPFCFGVCGTGNSTLGHCIANGSLALGASCDPTVPPYCSQGLVCYSNGDGGTCQQVCDPNNQGGPTCGSGKQCTALQWLGGQVPYFGLCE